MCWCPEYVGECCSRARLADRVENAGKAAGPTKLFDGWDVTSNETFLLKWLDRWREIINDLASLLIWLVGG